MGLGEITQWDRPVKHKDKVCWSPVGATNSSHGLRHVNRGVGHSQGAGAGQRLWTPAQHPRAGRATSGLRHKENILVPPASAFIGNYTSHRLRGDVTPLQREPFAITSLLPLCWWHLGCQGCSVSLTSGEFLCPPKAAEPPAPSLIAPSPSAPLPAARAAFLCHSPFVSGTFSESLVSLVTEKR